MNPDALPKTSDGRLDHLIEECAEVIKAALKLRRFGSESRWPTDNDPTKRDELLSELDDLEGAMKRVRDDLE